MKWCKKYDMPYIEDISVFRAVMFARHIIREGDKSTGVAISIAAQYYDVDQSEVAHHVGIAASNVNKRHAKSRQKANQDNEAKHSQDKPTGPGGWAEDIIAL